MTEDRLSDAPPATAQIDHSITAQFDAHHAPIIARADGLSSAKGRVPPRAAHGSAPRGTPPARRSAGRRSGTRGEHRRIVIPTGLVGSSHAERRRAGVTRRRDLRRDAEMPEDPLDHGRLLDERDEAQAAASPGTRQDVEPECTFHQGCPSLAAGLAPRRLRGVSLRSLLGRQLPQPRVAAIP